MYLRGKRYENEKNISTDYLKKGEKSPCGQNDHTGKNEI